VSIPAPGGPDNGISGAGKPSSLDDPSVDTEDGSTGDPFDGPENEPENAPENEQEKELENDSDNSAIRESEVLLAAITLTYNRRRKLHSFTS